MSLTKSQGFTLIEILIAIAIIAVLAAIALPNYTKNREDVFRNTCMANMKEIENAKAQISMTASDQNKELTWDDLKEYIRHKPECPQGGVYDGWKLSTPVCCSEHDWKTDPKLSGFVP